MATKNVIDLNSLRPSNPFADITGDEDIPFCLVDEIADKPIYIEAVKSFESDEKGAGVHVLFKTKDTKEYGRTCTHSVGIVSVLNLPSVKEALEEGNVILCAFEIGTSKTSGRKVYRLKNI